MGFHWMDTVQCMYVCEVVPGHLASPPPLPHLLSSHYPTFPVAAPHQGPASRCRSQTDRPRRGLRGSFKWRHPNVHRTAPSHRSEQSRKVANRKSQIPRQHHVRRLRQQRLPLRRCGEKRYRNRRQHGYRRGNRQTSLRYVSRYLASPARGGGGSSAGTSAFHPRLTVRGGGWQKMARR